MRAAGTSALDTRGIVDDTACHCHFDRELQCPDTATTRNGLNHASQPPEASCPEARGLAAHAVDRHKLHHHQPPARSATAPGFPALGHAQVVSHCRLPRNPAQPDPAPSAPENHWDYQRPDACARPLLRPRKLSLDIRAHHRRRARSSDHCPLRRWIAEPSHRLHLLRTPRPSLPHWL